jgi:hypothetical protein
MFSDLHKAIMEVDAEKAGSEANVSLERVLEIVFHNRF